MVRGRFNQFVLRNRENPDVGFGDQSESNQTLRTAVSESLLLRADRVIECRATNFKTTATSS
jgi:hypothetical protein